MTNEKINFKLKLGAISTPIGEQLKEQGFTIDRQRLKHYEKISDAINTMKLWRIITQTEKISLQKKLVESIAQNIKKRERKNKRD